MKGAIKTVAQKLLKVAAFAVMAVMVFVGGFTTSELLRKEEQQSVIKGTGNSLQAQQTINNGISLMAADGTDYVEDTLGDQAPYGALKVTATVTPATAKNQKLSWSCTWKGGGNEWSATAGSVDQYLRIQSVGTNAQELYVWSLQAFGCAVDVTATSTDGTNKTATMTVDFAKRMNGVTAISGIGGSFNVASSTLNHYVELGSYEASSLNEISFTPSCTVGSKDLTWNLLDYSISYEQGFHTAIENEFDMQCRQGWSKKYDGGGYDCLAYNIFEETQRASLFDGSNAASNYNTLLSCIDSCGGEIGELTLSFESAETDSFGKKYSCEVIFAVVVGDEYLQLLVTNVSLSDSTLTF